MERRLFLVFLFYILFFILVVFKLFYWQVFSFENLRGLAESQTNRTLILPAKRGSIYDNNGNPLVINQRSFLVFAEPSKIKDKKVSQILSEKLYLDEASVSAKINSENLKWIQLADKIDQSIKEQIESMNLSGIGFLEGFKRYYPEASMAAHLLGFVGKNTNGQDQGYFGIEGYYDEQLRGREGLRKQETDVKGDPILAGSHQLISPEDGRDLFLTIDRSVQYLVEQKLAQGLEKYGAKGGSVIVMNPNSGSIIAMASLPSYEAYRIQEYSTDLYKNPVIVSSYEPGSTFKVLIMAAAINEKSVEPDTIYNENGSVEVGNYSIKTWNQKYHGKIDMNQILQYSSNVGMVFVSEKLGESKLLEYLQKLGLDALTEVDLQEEAAPNLRPKNKWYKIDYATAAFGQGIALTPLQMIRAVAAIANGGKLVRPYVVAKVRQNNSHIIEIRPKIEREVYRKETASIVTEMMVNAVEKGETKYLKNLGVRVAGKTGTAQIPISGHYDTDRTIASFVGFFPAENPQIIMLVTLTEPTSSPWGSETAAPLFFSITKDLIPYYNISSSY